MHTINVLGKTYQVSEQAKYTYYAGLTSMLVPLLLGVYKKGLKHIKPEVIAITIFMIGLSTYVTNCVVKGGCDNYAWFLSVSAVITTFLLLVTMFAKNK